MYNNNIKIYGFGIPSNKKIYISLQYIKGIGKTTALKILKKFNIDFNIKSNNLSTLQLSNITNELKTYTVGENLINLIHSKIEYKKRIKTYEGMRHLLGLPLKGRTKTNAKTVKKKRKKVILK